MNKFYYTALLLMLMGQLHSQVSDSHGFAELDGNLTTKDHVPFWMRSDRFGSIPLPGASASLIAAVGKDYDSSYKLTDWGYSIEARGNFGNAVRADLIEGYLKARLWIFELRGGRSKEFMGLVDSSLSSGAFSVSGNALGIPKLELAIRDYYNLPIFSNLFSIKGNYAFGWIGDVPVSDSFNVPHAETYFHQQSIYLRLGKPGWRLKLEAGFNHQVYFGNERAINGPKYQLSGFKTYEYAVLGKTYLGSKIGNHLGSLDLGVDYEADGFRLLAYRQNFYDEGALYHLANLADGLQGISITNTRDQQAPVKWRKFVVELFTSKNQDGYPWSIKTPSGDENYYNNYQYPEGWSYRGLGLGNPFITPYSSTRSGFPKQPKDYFNNNRVIAIYTGMEGSVNDFVCTARFSYSLNYGTFGTSQWGYSTGGRFAPPIYGIFQEVKQFSAWMRVAKPVGGGLVVAVQAAVDAGHLFYNSGGLTASLSKTF
jgi:hypothetical protein